MKNILLHEVMHHPVVTIGIQATFSRVEEIMRTRAVRHLPVMDEYEHVAGIISQRDLYRILSPRRTSEGDVYDRAALDAILLQKVMTYPVVMLRPDDTLALAVQKMTAERLGCIPVVDAGRRLQGIVTKTDILKFLARVLNPASA